MAESDRKRSECGRIAMFVDGGAAWGGASTNKNFRRPERWRSAASRRRITAIVRSWSALPTWPSVRMAGGQRGGFSPPCRCGANGTGAEGLRRAPSTNAVDVDGMACFLCPPVCVWLSSSLVPAFQPATSAGRSRAEQTEGGESGPKIAPATAS